MEGPSFAIGPIAQGEDFGDRELIIDDIWRVLEKGNVLLKAPRRFGKSSIMYKLYERPRDGFEVARKGEATKKELFRLFRTLSEGRLKEEAFSYLMTDIENDFYVTYNPEADSYRFSTNILRDWWLRYYDLVED